MKMILTSLVLGLLSLGGAAVAGAAEEPFQPNILFIFADDMSYELVREFGYTDIDTPNLDRLARHGTTFTHAYNMGSWCGAVCFASRAMLNTGRSIWNAQAVCDAANPKLDPDTLWPSYMGAAGYQTFFTGKWHVQADAKKVFDVVANLRGAMPGSVPSAYNRPLAGVEDVWNPYDKSLGGYWQGGKHWSEVVADDAVGFMDTAKTNGKPFFMYLSFNAVHDPRQVSKEYVDRYPLERIKVPENFLPEYPYKDKIRCSARLRDEKLGPFPRTHHAVKVHRQEYYALASHMDAQIGRILEALKRSGQDKNTYIFFTADHGLAVGHHGLFGKQNMYDHSLRVPFIVVGPGVEKNKRIDAPIYLQDVMPTSLELAGVDQPEHVEFHSLMPLLSGERTKSHLDAVYGAYFGVQRAMIHDGHKLILYPAAKVARLYDLEADPLEMHDLARDPKSGPLMKKLFARFLALQESLGDEREIKSVFPELLDTSADADAAAAASENRPAKPNVLFLSVDDLRPELGCYGEKAITPRMDELAHNGLLFERAYCQYPVCMPSRVSLLAGIRDAGGFFRSSKDRGILSMPQLFKNSGYTTVSIGKVYHFTNEDRGAWTRYFTDTFPESPPNQGYSPGYQLKENQEVVANYRTKIKDGPNLARPNSYEISDTPDAVHPDGMVADLAIKQLREFKGNGQPFFLAAGFYRPHLPFTPPKRYWDLYDREKIELPGNRHPIDGGVMKYNWEELRRYGDIPNEGPLSEDQARRMIHGYHASVSFSDAMVGKILDELKRLELDKNTIVVLWGDHGWNLGEHGFWCKHTCYETSTRTALMASVPWLPKGRKTMALVELVDIYPTLCELTGLEAPSHLEGTSFVPLFNSPDRPWKKAVFTQGMSIRTPRYRLTRYKRGAQKPDALELFDHDTDPEENVNIAYRPGNKTVVRKLIKQLDAGWKAARPPGIDSQ